MKATVTSQELEMLQAMNTQYSRFKLMLADLELQKASVIKEIEVLKADFMENEAKLVSKYGKNAVIDIKTGDITYSKEDLPN
jgi:hypothetical protein